MGEKLPRVIADEIIRVLKKAGFIKVDQSGSHRERTLSQSRGFM